MRCITSAGIGVSATSEGSGKTQRASALVFVLPLLYRTMYSCADSKRAQHCIRPQAIVGILFGFIETVRHGFMVCFYFKMETIQVLIVLCNPKYNSEGLLIKVRILGFGFGQSA